MVNHLFMSMKATHVYPEPDFHCLKPQFLDPNGSDLFFDKHSP